jgi:hypothetical protein
MGITKSVDVDDVEICWGQEKVLEGLERVLVGDLIEETWFLQM